MSDSKIKAVKDVLSPVNAANDLSDSLNKIISNIWHYKIIVTDGQPITVANVVIATLLFIIGIKLAKYLSNLVKTKLLKALKLDQNSSNAIQKIIHYLSLVFISLMALDIANVPIRSFTVIGGALAFGLGFGSQNILSNFISGLIMMVEKPIKLGNIIEVGDQIGRVINIGARCVHLRTPTNFDVLVPNSYMLQNNIINWTLEDSSVRTSLKVKVAYYSSSRKAEELIIQAMHENENILKSPDPLVFLLSFDDNAFNFELNFWVDMLGPVDRRMIMTQINHRIVELFREYEIALAIPQREVAEKSPLYKP